MIARQPLTATPKATVTRYSGYYAVIGLRRVHCAIHLNWDGCVVKWGLGIGGEFNYVCENIFENRKRYVIFAKTGIVGRYSRLLLDDWIIVLFGYRTFAISIQIFNSS